MWCEYPDSDNPHSGNAGTNYFFMVTKLHPKLTNMHKREY